MNVVQIDRKFKKLSSDELFIDIYNIIDSIFIANVENIIQKISSDDNYKLFLYVVYEILTSNNLNVPNIKNTPRNGVQLCNPDTNQPYGIYHVHLKDKYVLLWYLTYSEYGYIINFEYIKHPERNDNYKSIINEIYERSDDGYNLELNNYFNNLTNILNESNINTKYIDMYNVFLKKIQFE